MVKKATERRKAQPSDLWIEVDSTGQYSSTESATGSVGRAYTAQRRKPLIAIMLVVVLVSFVVVGLVALVRSGPDVEAAQTAP
jgi:hypothetical protein